MDLNHLFDITIFGISIKGPLVFCTKALIIYLFVQAVVSTVKFLFRRSLKKKGKLFLDQTNVGFIQRMIVYAIYLIGTTAFLALIPGMEKISNSILASAGILAMAVGLASQEALSNIIGGMFIVFSRPFRVGDIIQVDDVVNGTVAEITLRHTIIRSLENRMILIPNSKINSSTIVNSTIGDQRTCSFIEVGVAYDVDLDKAMTVMREEIMKHPLLIDQRTEEEKKNGIPQVMIRITNLGDSAITLKAWAWAATSGNAFVLKCDSLKSIKERYDRENIEIPYPYFNHIIQK